MRPSAETPSSMHWRRFYFQLTRVHSASELFGRCALQIYLLTYLLITALNPVFRCVGVQTLLDLGASPNYKDERGLTPLYHAVMKNSQAGPHSVQMLLFNRSDIGVVDDSWNTELHQVSELPISTTVCATVAATIPATVARTVALIYCCNDAWCNLGCHGCCVHSNGPWDITSCLSYSIKTSRSWAVTLSWHLGSDFLREKYLWGIV